jgi:hypothetical protein
VAVTVAVAVAVAVAVVVAVAVAVAVAVVVAVAVAVVVAVTVALGGTGRAGPLGLALGSSVALSLALALGDSEALSEAAGDAESDGSGRRLPLGENEGARVGASPDSESPPPHAVRATINARTLPPARTRRNDEVMTHLRSHWASLGDLAGYGLALRGGATPPRLGLQIAR